MEILNDYSLLRLNTFGIDAYASKYVELSSVGDYEAIVRSGLLRECPFFVLGGGSNVVFPTRYEGIVVHPTVKGVKMLESNGDYCYVEAAAGEVWADFVDRCIDNGWYGLENMAGIPGCVGASPVQNVGAYGREAKDFIACVHCYDVTTGEECRIDSKDCQFAYRWSRFKGEWSGRYLIFSVVFRLNLKYVPCLGYKALATEMDRRGLANPSARVLADTVKSLRDSKLPNPNKIGSAGSFFKNPVVAAAKYERLKSEYPDITAYPTDDGGYKLGAGWMVEQCGLKGTGNEHVGVYDKQALVLVNRGGCTGDDVRRFAEEVKRKVMERFGVSLEYEAIFV